MTTKARNKVSHTEALARLQAGNNRFVQNVRSVEAMGSRSQRDALVRGQDPFAIVLSCSDSRVPSELVFDCGFGDLFVVRVAGNVVAASIVGSIEFAASAFGTELVVVMGHTNCGAVAATLDALAKGKGANILSANVGGPRVLPKVDQRDVGVGEAQRDARRGGGPRSAVAGLGAAGAEEEKKARQLAEHVAVSKRGAKGLASDRWLARGRSGGR